LATFISLENGKISGSNMTVTEDLFAEYGGRGLRIEG